MPLKTTRRALLALSIGALAGAAQADLPDDRAEPDDRAIPHTPRTPRNPGFALERADLVCTKSMGAAANELW